MKKANRIYTRNKKKLQRKFRKASYKSIRLSSLYLRHNSITQEMKDDVIEYVCGDAVVHMDPVSGAMSAVSGDCNELINQIRNAINFGLQDVRVARDINKYQEFAKKLMT